MLRSIVFGAFCVVMFSGISEGMRVEQKEDVSDVCLEFRLLPIEGLTECEKGLIFSPTRVAQMIPVDSKTRTAVEMLARRPTYHMLVGSYDKNQTALKNWLVFYNACTALGGSFLEQLEEEKDRLMRRFENIDAYFLDDSSNACFYITGILEQIAVFNKEYRLQLVEIYEKGLYGVSSNPERAVLWKNFQEWNCENRI